jgi:deoxyribodipyrimidine photolyase
MSDTSVIAYDRPVILLFRKDLRLDDNPALAAALQSSSRVVGAAIVRLPGTIHITCIMRILRMGSV